MTGADEISLNELAENELSELAGRFGDQSSRFRIMYDGHAVEVSTNDAISRLWAEFYLAPLMRLQDISGQVEVIADYFHFTVPREVMDSLIAEWSGDSPIALQMRRCGRLLKVSERRSLILDPVGPIIYSVDHIARAVMAVGAPTDTNRKDLARQCRELLLARSLMDGWIVLHASAVGVKGDATLFVGGKGAGKSTLALTCLEHPMVAYISNDRVLAKWSNNEILVRPYPMSVRLGGGTLRNSARLVPHLHAYDHLEAALLPLNEQYAHSDKLELGLSEFLTIMDSDLLLESRLRRLVFPQMDPEADDAVLREIGLPEVARRLAPQMYVPDPDGNGWLRDQLYGAVAPSSTTLEALSRVPGVVATGNPESIVELLQLVQPKVDRPQPPVGWRRGEQPAHLVAVMDHVRNDRQLQLSRWNTRAVHEGEVHEILTTPDFLAGSVTADHCWYIGFARFGAGLLCVGDRVLVGDQEIGYLAGFDGTHLPNHMNIVISSREMKTGVNLSFSPGDRVTFVPSGSR